MEKTFKSNQKGLQGLNLAGMQIMQNEHGNVMLVIFKGKAYGTNDMGANQLHAFLKSLVNGTCTVQPKKRLSAEQKAFIMANCPDVLTQHEKAWKDKKREKRNEANQISYEKYGIDTTYGGELTAEEKEIIKKRKQLEIDFKQSMKIQENMERGYENLINYLKALNYTADSILNELKEDYNGSITKMARDYASLHIFEKTTAEQIEQQLKGLIGV